MKETEFVVTTDGREETDERVEHVMGVPPCGLETDEHSGCVHMTFVVEEDLGEVLHLEAKLHETEGVSNVAIDGED